MNRPHYTTPCRNVVDRGGLEACWNVLSQCSMAMPNTVSMGNMEEGPLLHPFIGDFVPWI